VVILLVTIGGYSISDYWWLVYSWLLVVILLVVILLAAIGDYSIVSHWWLLMAI
jgi:hypothetical protein